MLSHSSEDPFETLDPSNATEPLILHIDGVDQGDNDSDAIESSSFSFCWAKRQRARVLEAGLWISPWAAFVACAGEDSWITVSSYMCGILLVLLRCNKRSRIDEQLPDDPKPLMATNLVPYLLSSIPVFFLDEDQDPDFDDGVLCTFLVLLAVVSGTGTRFQPRCLSRVGRRVRSCVLSDSNPTDFRARMTKTALLVGLWLSPMLVAFVTTLYYDVFDGGIGNPDTFYFALLNINNGCLLLLLWCTKQSDDELDRDHHEKQLLASELIPAIFSALFLGYLDDLDEFLLTGFLLFVLLIVFVVTYLFCYGIPAWIEIKMKNFDPMGFKSLEEQYSEELRDLEEEENRELRAQMDRLAYLEGLVPSARRNRNRKCLLLQRKFGTIALVLVLLALILLTIGGPRLMDMVRESKSVFAKNNLHVLSF